MQEVDNRNLNYHFRHLLDHLCQAGDLQNTSKLIEKSRFLECRAQLQDQQGALTQELIAHSASLALEHNDYHRFFQYCLRAWGLASMGKALGDDRVLPFLPNLLPQEVIWGILRQTGDNHARMSGLSRFASECVDPLLKKQTMELLTAELEESEDLGRDLSAIGERMGPEALHLLEKFGSRLDEDQEPDVYLAFLHGYQSHDKLRDENFWVLAKRIWKVQGAIRPLADWILNAKTWGTVEVETLLAHLDREDADYWPCMCAALSRSSIMDMHTATGLWRAYFGEIVWTQALLKKAIWFLYKFPGRSEFLSQQIDPELRAALFLFLEEEGDLPCTHSTLMSCLDLIDDSGIRVRLLLMYLFRNREVLALADLEQGLAGASIAMREIYYDTDAETLARYLMLSERVLGEKPTQHEWVFMCTLYPMTRSRLQGLVAGLESRSLLTYAADNVHVFAGRVSQSDGDGFLLQIELLKQIITRMCCLQRDASFFDEYAASFTPKDKADLRESLAVDLLQLGERDHACHVAEGVASTRWHLQLLIYDSKRGFGNLYGSAVDTRVFADEFLLLKYISAPPLQALDLLCDHQGGISSRTTWSRAVLDLGIYHLRVPGILDEELRIRLSQIDPLQLVPEDEEMAYWNLPRLAFFYSLIEPHIARSEFDKVLVQILERQKETKQCQSEMMALTMDYLRRFSQWQVKQGRRTIDVDKMGRRFVHQSRKLVLADGGEPEREAFTNLSARVTRRSGNGSATTDPDTLLKELEEILGQMETSGQTGFHPREWLLLDDLRAVAGSLYREDSANLKKIASCCLKRLKANPSGWRGELLIWQHAAVGSYQGFPEDEFSFADCRKQVETAQRLPGYTPKKTKVPQPEKGPAQSIDFARSWDKTRFDFLSRAWPNARTFNYAMLGIMVFLLMFLLSSYAALQGKQSWLLNFVSFSSIPMWLPIVLLVMLGAFNTAVSWFIVSMRRPPQRVIRWPLLPLLAGISFLPFAPTLLCAWFVKEGNNNFLFKQKKPGDAGPLVPKWAVKNMSFHLGKTVYALCHLLPVLVLGSIVLKIGQSEFDSRTLILNFQIALLQAILVLVFLTNVRIKKDELSDFQKTVTCLGILLCCIPQLPFVILGALIASGGPQTRSGVMNRVIEQGTRSGRYLARQGLPQIIEKAKQNLPWRGLKVRMLNLEESPQKQIRNQKEGALTLSLKLVTLLPEFVFLGALSVRGVGPLGLILMFFLATLLVVGFVAALIVKIRPTHGTDRELFYANIFWEDCMIRVGFWCTIGFFGGVLAGMSTLYITLVIALIGLTYMTNQMPFLIRSGAHEIYIFSLLMAMLTGLIIIENKGFAEVKVEVFFFLGLLWLAGFFGRRHWIRPFTWKTLPGGKGRTLFILTLLPFGGLLLPLWAYLRHGSWYDHKQKLYGAADQGQP